MPDKFGSVNVYFRVSSNGDSRERLRVVRVPVNYFGPGNFRMC